MKFWHNTKKVFGLSLAGVLLAVGFGLEILTPMVSEADGGVRQTMQVSQSSMQTALRQGFDASELMKVSHYKVGQGYRIKGSRYKPQADFDYKEEGLASWYGPGFHGKKTANGEIFNQDAITAAHPTLQMPCVVRVTNLDTGKDLIVRVNDRGPYHKDNRVIDLSRKAAELLGFRKQGVARVRVEVLKEESIALAAACLGKKVGVFQKELRSKAVKLSQNKNTPKRSV